ncbi:hypothetical protein PN441_03015 [Spirulina major CS-329]|uniref:hypothetical protein n=1 Tax=Spirulina TaxID=1154 RepID=UPI00232FD67A|nr:MULTISPECIES: hypothetical protein [Spirulina]MDB9496501.1 hypothetical protein [Spirulina subsalsa CS-330]MDB9502028.1 hypothetical protein [Spirulina major CS-329]
MELLLLLAALVIAWLVFTWLVKVLKTSVQTAFTVAVILVVLQVTLGIGPQDLWNAIVNLPQILFSPE